MQDGGAWQLPPSCLPASRRDAESTAGGSRCRTAVKNPCRQPLRCPAVTAPETGPRYGTHTPGMGRLQAENPAGAIPRKGNGFRSAIRINRKDRSASELSSDDGGGDGSCVLIEQQRGVVVDEIVNEMERGGGTRGSHASRAAPVCGRRTERITRRGNRIRL